MPTNITPDDLVRREVFYCVSSLVSALAAGYGHSDSREMNELHEQAFELALPIEDWEEAAHELGYDIRHDWQGFYACTTEEADHEDDGNVSCGFDGRQHFLSIEAAAQHVCEDNDQDAYPREVFEHWIVSDWLADKLADKGEKIDKDFAGLIVWARTTTGQGIASDSVIEAIAAEINSNA